MVRLSELESWFLDLWNIIVDLHIGYNNAKRLTETKYEKELEIKRHGFFQHHWYQLRFIMVVQISKLLSDSDNQKRNFYKLIRRLSNEKYDDQLKNKLNENLRSDGSVYRSRKEVITGMLSLKEQFQKNEKTISKVVTARNKLYAHKDESVEIPQITLDELKTLLDLCSSLYQCTHGRIFDVDTQFGQIQPWSIDYVLRNSSENLKNFHDRIDKEIKDSENKS